MTHSHALLQVKEDAKVGEIVYTLVAKDLDISSPEALNYAASEPITAVDKNGKEVTSDFTFKVFFISLYIFL